MRSLDHLALLVEFCAGRLPGSRLEHDSRQNLTRDLAVRRPEYPLSLQCAGSSDTPEAALPRRSSWPAWRSSSTAATTPRASPWSPPARSRACAPSAISPRCAAAVNGAANGAVFGIGHTRWATHGRVTEANAHPHDDTSGKVHIALNGIVENWTDLKQALQAEGAEFTSETDAEVVAHLIAARYDGDLVEAVRTAYGELRGHYAFVAVHADEPGVLVGARKECPLVVGVGEGENFIASAIPAFMDLDAADPDGRERRDRRRDPRGHALPVPDGSADRARRRGGRLGQETAEKGGYDSFMLKEIHEQPEAVAETVADRLVHDTVELGDIGVSDDELKGLRRVVIVACGTSYHAGLIGRYAIETWSRVPVEMDVASEFRYRDPGDRRARSGDRDHPVGRDGRHARGDAARAREGRQGARDHERDGQPGDPRLRRRALHAGRPGDRRRRDQDLRLAGRRHVPLRAQAGAGPRHARAGALRGPCRRAEGACPS